MKHILIKTTDGGVWQMGLHVIGAIRLEDGAKFGMGADKKSQQNGTLRVSDDGIMRVRLSRPLADAGLGSFLQETYELLMPVLDYDKGIAPEGLQFVYPTVESQIAKWPPDMQAKVVSWREVPWEGIPWVPGTRDTDKTFRAAWEDTTPEPKIDINLTKCQAIHMDRIRVARNAKLDALDKEWNRAAGRKQAAQADAIEAQREVLRNIPQTFDLTVAKTPDELKALWPTELGR